MLEWMEVRDFQRYKKFLVRFDPRLTTLVGRTDAGKSALLRALGFVCLNAGRGDLVRWGKDRTVVALAVDGRVLVRTKGAANSYRIDDQEALRAVGTSVPAPVADLLAVCPDNFQWQLDPPFLFTATPGQVSRHLNAVVNLDGIDRTLAAADSQVRHAASVVKVSRERLAAAKGTAAATAWTADLVKGVEELGVLDRQRQATAARASELRLLVDKVKSLRQHSEGAKEAAEDGSSLVHLGRRLRRLRRTRRALARLVSDGRALERAAADPPPDPGPLLAFRTEADAVAERRRAVEAMVTEWRALAEEAADAKAALANARKRLEKKTKGRCPTCLQPLPTSSRSSAPTSTCRPRPPSPARPSRTGRRP